MKGEFTRNQFSFLAPSSDATITAPKWIPHALAVFMSAVHRQAMPLMAFFWSQRDKKNAMRGIACRWTADMNTAKACGIHLGAVMVLFLGTFLRCNHNCSQMDTTCLGSIHVCRPSTGDAPHGIFLVPKR